MKFQLAAIASLTLLWGCQSAGTDPSASDQAALQAKKKAVSAAAGDINHGNVCNALCVAGESCCNGKCQPAGLLCEPPLRCGPVAGPPTSAGAVDPAAIVACPASEQCCNGFCVPDNVLCVAPPPPQKCGPVVDPTASGAQPGAIIACPATEQCCNGLCVPDNVLCVAPPPILCGPTAGTDPTAPQSVCPPGLTCCDGKCTIGCIDPPPPPQCKADSDCVAPLAPCKLCADGTSSCPEAKCVSGRCEVSFPSCPGQKTCNPASANPANQCGPYEACCNGLCQPDGAPCILPPPPAK
jgi:hypothetical protein